MAGEEEILTLVLSLNDVNKIIGALDQMPHGQVRAIFDNIVNQSNTQLNGKAASEEATTGTTNGE